MNDYERANKSIKSLTAEGKYSFHGLLVDGTKFVGNPKYDINIYECDPLRDLLNPKGRGYIFDVKKGTGNVKFYQFYIPAYDPKHDLLKGKFNPQIN